MENQRDYYSHFIASNPSWEYVEGYVDEGISGVCAQKRVGFQRMIRDAQKGLFDLILTKEVSRFARDLEDSIHYIRLLKDAGVGVFFENQNLNTFDANSELILNIMFNLAQDESRKLSSRVKFGHRESILKGRVLGSSNIMGYRKNHCRLEIVPKEAEFIKCLFSLYASGEYGFYKLSKKLGSLGYFNQNGNYYDKDSLKRMIQNPKYMGYYRGRTTETLDYRSKRRKKIPKEEQVIHKCLDGSIPPIVSEELWHQANSRLKKRHLPSSSSSLGLKYPFSSKIQCGEHSVNFQRSHGRDGRRATWCCGEYLKYRTEACLSPILLEEELYSIFQRIFERTNPSFSEILSDLFENYSLFLQKGSLQKQKQDLEEEVQKKEKRKREILDLVLDNVISKEEMRSAFSQMEVELSVLRKKLDSLSIRQDLSFLEEKMKSVSSCDLLDGWIRSFVKKVVVEKINGSRKHVFLFIYLDFGEEEESTLWIMEEEFHGVKNSYVYSVFSQ